VCPVYERVGGHAYGSVYPGPIGAVLSPQLTGIADNPSLPFASTLCGACLDVCPVAIDIPAILVHLRGRVVEQERSHSRFVSPESLLMSGLATLMSNPRRWSVTLRLSRVGRLLPTRGRLVNSLPGPLSRWSRYRDLPAVPRRSFRSTWRRGRR
jgi:L-lactate dehydrogenase complex protein LldF